MSYSEEIHRHVVDDREVELRKRIGNLMLENEQAKVARESALAQLICELNAHIREACGRDMGKVVEMRDATIAELQERLKKSEHLNMEFRTANAGFELALTKTKAEAEEWSGWGYRMMAAYAAAGAGKANTLPDLWFEGRLIADKRGNIFSGVSKEAATELIESLRAKRKPLGVVMRELERHLRAQAAPHLMVTAPDVIRVEPDGVMGVVDGGALRCCYISGSNESTVPGALARGCQAIACWGMLSDGQTPDLESHSCDRHLPFMLEPGVSSVWPIQMPASWIEKSKAFPDFTVDQNIVPIGNCIGWGLQTIDGVTTVFAYTDTADVLKATNAGNYWPPNYLKIAQAVADRLNGSYAAKQDEVLTKLQEPVKYDPDKAIRFDDLALGVQGSSLTEVPVEEAEGE